MSLGPLSALTANGQSSVAMATTDSIPFEIDMTNALPTGGSVSSPTSTLVDLKTGQAATLTDAPTVLGNVVTQIVRGPHLLAQHSYRLAVVFTAATNTILTVVFEIDVLI